MYRRINSAQKYNNNTHRLFFQECNNKNKEFNNLNVNYNIIQNVNNDLIMNEEVI